MNWFATMQKKNNNGCSEKCGIHNEALLRRELVNPCPARAVLILFHAGPKQNATKIDKIVFVAYLGVITFL